MGRILEWCFCFIFTTRIYLSTGQDLPQEQLRTVTTCSLESVNISCTNDEIVAVHSLYFRYHATCESICCDPASSHYNAENDTSTTMFLRRECSGKRSCTIELSGVRNFQSVGQHNPSYVVIYYYCLPDSRTTSICSDSELNSIGTPVYLTSKDYPSVTTGDGTCSCSLEVETCTSGVTLYLIDADLYYDTSNCKQNLIFYDGKDAPVKEFKCGNYYTNNIATFSLNTSYVRIRSIDNSTTNQEGYFFFGIVASDINTKFRLSCTAVTQTKCFDCGIPENIPYGRIMLRDISRSGYGALADVTCFAGYDYNTKTISCLETGQWENATCSPKDCGQPDPDTIANGNITTVVSGVTTFGAKAKVTCDIGYEIKGYCDIGSQFQCGDGSCIILDKKCDNFEDCPDNLDENSVVCGTPVCLENQILCNGFCVDKSTICVVSGTNDTESEADTVSCLATGNWEKIRCVIKDCGDLSVIEHGNLTLDTGNKTYGSTATVECESGYTPSKASVLCEASGQWQSATCNVTDCLSPSITNGNFTLTTGKTTYGSSASVTCITGYTASKTLITCQANGQWENAMCDINDCLSPSITNGNFTLTTGKTKYGSSASVTCITGYTASKTLITCQANGQWENAMCDINVSECGPIPDIENGRIDIPENTPTHVNMTAKVSCYIGYKSSRTNITCLLSGQWQTASCNITDCGKPPSILNGEVNILEGSFTTYDSVAKIVCRENYKPSQYFVACQETGRWETGSCVPKDDDEKQFVILVSVGGAVLLIAVIILAGLTLWSRAQNSSANLHKRREQSFTNIQENAGTFQANQNQGYLNPEYRFRENYSRNWENSSLDIMSLDLPQQDQIIPPNEFTRLEG